MQKRSIGFMDEIIFPGGFKKAFTMSYDDGTVHDRRFVELLNRHRIKATFNLNSGFFGLQRKNTSGPFAGLDISVIDEDEVPVLYEGHEIAAHGLTHASPAGVGTPHFMYETVTDKANLERLVKKPVRGYAWPFGHYNDEAKTVLRLAGIRYARAVETTGGFGLPSDLFAWKGTVHHNDERLMALAEDFCTDSSMDMNKKLFYVWGHSFEFEMNRNWEMIEAFLTYMDEHREGIWFAANIEIAEYLEAFNRLEYSADGDMIYNPSALAVSLSRSGRIFTAEPGKTVNLAED